MKVKDLINKLSQEDPEMEVHHEWSDHDDYDSWTRTSEIDDVRKGYKSSLDHLTRKELIILS